MKRILLTLTFILFIIPIGISQDLPSYLPSDGLVAYYPFNGNANDKSGNGYHGTVYGATLTADRSGNENSSYNFDGVDDYISGTMQGVNQLNESTVSTWIKYTGDEGGRPYDLFFQYGTYGNHTLAYGYNYIEKKLDLYSNCFEFTRYTSVDLNDDWINLVITDDDSITKIYVNGILVEFFDAEILNNSCFQGSYEFYIGGGSDNQYVTGSIDEIILWSRALTEQEIQGLYTSSNGDILLNGVVSAENNQIKNVSDPTHAQDAATKNYTYSKAEVDALVANLQNQIDEPVYTIGYWPELGGYVFMVSADGKHGLVAETEDQGVESWYNAQNLISNPSNHSEVGQNFTDWRLPTRYELAQMYSQKSEIESAGGDAFGAKTYWTSNQSIYSVNGLEEETAWRQNFGTGIQYSSNAIRLVDDLFVRSVREF